MGDAGLANKLGLDLGFNKSNLQKELSNACLTEEKRLAVDNMKKKAIHTARSYKEFENFVACATQKCVTSREMAQFEQSLKGNVPGQYNVTVNPREKQVPHTHPAPPGPDAMARPAHSRHARRFAPRKKR